MNGRDTADGRLVTRMLAGDEGAFEEFFARYFPGLYRFAMARLSFDADAAEEVVQATLCRAVGKLHTFDTRTTWSPGGPEGRWTFHLDVINMLGAENAGVMSGDLVYFEGDCRPTMTREPEFYFPFLPYVSVRLRF
jgi:hypothetical protein